MNLLAEKIKDLDSRVSRLEQENQSPAANSSVHPRMHEEMKDVQTQLKQLTDTIDSQQKILELKERERRANNLVLVGLDEKEGNEDTLTLVGEFLSTKMELTSVNITQARRLGRIARGANKPRPILMTLGSQMDKATVTANRAKLSGTRVYINNDLTKEQRLAERKLRETKRKLSQHPDFKEKKVTIFRNKVCVDRSPVSEETLRSAGISQ